MRRSICYCEPSLASAGEINTWHFVFTPSADLPKGTKLKFDLQSKGRDIDWEIPSANLKKTSNTIHATMDKHKVIQAKEVESPDSYVPSFEFVLPAKLEAGETFTIIVGSTKAPKQNGTKAQASAQRRRSFNLFVDPSGKGNYDEPEVFTLDIRGNTLASIRVLAPSFVTRNKRFDVIVRFEDEYGNLTSRAPADTLVELSHEHLRENLTWKLFIPETGFIALPNLYFNEPGFYTIQLLNTKTKEIFRSAPILCFAENPKHLFWGLTHGESERIDSTENIESCLRHFRDDRASNFYMTSPFENQEETSAETWKLINQNVIEFDEADRFATFLGFQWAGAKAEEGLRQIVYMKDGKQLLHRKDPKYSTLKKIYKSFSPKEILSIPSFTMGKGFEYDFKNYDPDFERVVEIYNSWGSSECTKKEGNDLYITSKGKNGVQECAEGSIQKALQNNCRFGFVAGGLDDRGIYSDFFESDQEQYAPGLTAIIASEHSKAALAEALYNRSCYATTGERIILGISLAGVPMGGETTTATKHGLRVNRHLSGYVAGTANIQKIEIVRNGKVIKTFEPDGYSLNFTYDDMTPLEKVVITPKDKKPPFVYYYIRVVQEDGHTAWSSPIWVDLEAPLPSARGAARRQKASMAKKPILIEENEDDEDEDEDEDDDFEE
jgi:hypothetical protein